MEENDHTNFPSKDSSDLIDKAPSNEYGFPAVIDIKNIISLQENDILPISEAMKYNNPEKNYTEKCLQNEKLRKASCDVNLFESEKNPDSANESNKDQFSRMSENSREIAEEISSENPRDQERIKTCIITEKYKYIGETLNGLRDGFGICESKNGKTYIGYWKNNFKHGIGKILFNNGDYEQGEFFNNNSLGYYEIYKKDKYLIKGIINDNKFNEFVVVERNSLVYEGEPQKEDSKLTFGRLIYYKKDESRKIFIGNVSNYQTESGCGLFYKDNVLFYGEIKNKIMINYIENYANEGGAFLGFLKDNKKNGLGICFIKDGRVCIGEFEDDQKKGPILYFTGAPKPTVKMELYLLGFKTKTLEKMETIKKYLQLNYPEYCDILKIDFQKLIDKITPEIMEEITDSAKLIESFKSAEGK